MSEIGESRLPAGEDRPAFRVILAGLLLAGAALRFWGAWVSRYITDFDSSVVALMSRHMAEGREWPVFFYGQHYMGSLEPMVSALLVRLFGPTGFAVCLGPALVAIAALGLLYAWAKDAGGPRAGLAALALCLIGPAGYFEFQFAPRGGYMVALLAATFLLWKSGRLSAPARTGEDAAREFFLLGVVAGLGLWSHAIIVSAVLAAVVVLLIGWRGAFWRRPGPILAGLGGVVIGLAPWWIYNLAHGWPSLEMISYTTGVPCRFGLRLAWKQWLRMMGLYDWPARLRLLVAMGYLALAAGGIAVAGRDLIVHRRWNRAAAARLNALLFLGFSVVFLVRSRFVAMNTSRYLLPFVPALALFSGVAFAAAKRSWGRRTAGGLGLLLLLTQVMVLPPLFERGRQVPGLLASQDELRAALEAENVRTLYAPLQAYPLNFMLGGDFTFSDSRKVCYAPFYEALEFTDHPAFLKNHGGIGGFLAAGGGQARQAGPPGSRFHFALVPPRQRLEPVPRADLASISFNGAEARELADLRTDTGRKPDFSRETQAVEIRFALPLPLGRLRLEFDPPWIMPTGFAVEILSPERGDWSELLPLQRTTRFFWSGPRPFDGGRRQRLEFQLDGAPVDSLRVRLVDPDAGRRPPAWCLTEVSAFQAGPGQPADEGERLPELLRLLRANGVRRLYADRWESNRIYLETGGEIEVELNPKLDRAGGIAADGTVRADAGTAFLVRAPDGRDTKKVLQEIGQAFREFAVDPWVLVVGDESPGTPPAGDLLPLYWTGYALRLDHAANPAGSEDEP